jgi:two-component SAPR family response regulator
VQFSIYRDEKELSASKDINIKHLALIDFENPSIDAFELALKLYQEHSHLRIVFLTRFHNQEAEIFEDYEIEYLLKPLNLARLHSLIFRAKSFKRKAIDMLKGDVSIKMFGNMEVKINGRNVRFKRRLHKEILAYLILNEHQAYGSKMREDILSSSLYPVELDALMYQLRIELLSLSKYIQILKEDGLYRLVLHKVEIDYESFMYANIGQLSPHRLERIANLYGKGLLHNFESIWQNPHIHSVQEHYLTMHQKLMECFVAQGDFDKVESIRFKLLSELGYDLYAIDQNTKHYTSTMAID